MGKKGGGDAKGGAKAKGGGDAKGGKGGAKAAPKEEKAEKKGGLNSVKVGASSITQLWKSNVHFLKRVVNFPNCKKAIINYYY